MKVIFAGDWRAKIELRLKQLAENRNLAPIFVPIRNLAWAAVLVRNFLNSIEEYCPPIPIISVGNITVGGTGKTPFVKWLVQRLSKLGHKPAILTPLGERDDETKEYSEDTTISKVYKVFAGRNRVVNAQRAIEWGATIIVLDDGFQYQSLHRDVDIVLWDSTSLLSESNPFLREPLRNLKRATCIVLSKGDALSDEEQKRLKQKIEEWAGEGKVVASFGYEPYFDKSSITDCFLVKDIGARKILLVAGIANLRYFLLTALKAGFKSVAIVCFPDHHRYNHSDAKFIAEIASAEGVDAVLTTKKDAVKLKNLWQSETPLVVLEVKLRWLWGEDEVWRIVERAIHRQGGR
ncbi:MAG: tetraacyldisaccharide 4'-kinase [Armatimonadetes bacterium]|nr:tetraacyldisaccharide 4'-kinase [Armatimonadota bacterium]MDW8029590.1 tetraacyldisaccharide 4'-kinase [Armatimonadota bacterium]